MNHPRPDEIARYFADNSDFTHRLNYDLNEDSLVLDLGGFDGIYSLRIYNKYRCNISIFEPVKEFYHKILNNTKNINKIKCYNYGLGQKDSKEMISIKGDASNIYDQDGPKEEIEIKNILDFIIQNKINNIDLLKINIEGGEYDLLEFMLENNLHLMCDNIQVQFHPQFDSDDRRSAIQAHLSKTHYLTYNYIYVFENWKRK